MLMRSIELLWVVEGNDSDGVVDDGVSMKRFVDDVFDAEVQSL